MDKAPASDLVELSSVLDDPRALDGRRHRLADILVRAFCTVLCGQEEFTAIERFGLAKATWRRGFLGSSGGLPSHDTFRAVLSALDARPLAQTLIDWTEGVRTKPGGEIVAIVGKRVRRSVAKGAQAARHLVNAWAVDSGLCRGQEQTSAKSNFDHCRAPAAAPVGTGGRYRHRGRAQPPERHRPRGQGSRRRLRVGPQGQPSALAPGGQRLPARRPAKHRATDPARKAGVLRAVGTARLSPRAAPRVFGVARNTIARWLQKKPKACRL